MRRTIFVGCLLITWNLRAQQAFFDGTFADTDWDLITRVFGNSGTVSAGQSASAGNPGSSRQIIDTVATESLVHGYHLGKLMIYQPSLHGAVRSIRYSFDYQTLAGAEVGVALLIRQGTNLFFGGYNIVAGDAWQSRTINELRLDQFSPLDPVALDFSEAAAPLQFGFMTVNSQASGPGYDATIRIDNFSVSINPVTLNITLADSQHVRIAWPTNATDLNLEYASTLPAAEWTPVTTPPVVEGDQFVSIAEATEPARFYRLRKP